MADQFQLPSHEVLSSLDHATLYRMRDATNDPVMQNILAGYEHQAFAREVVANNPLMSVPVALATPIYQVSKMLPGMQSRSQSSFGQLGQSYKGIGQGLAQAWNSLASIGQ